MAIARRGDDQFSLRFPGRLRDRVKAAARKAGRSMNSEIIYQLESAYGLQQATTGERFAAMPPAAAQTIDA